MFNFDRSMTLTASNIDLNLDTASEYLSAKYEILTHEGPSTEAGDGARGMGLLGGCPLWWGLRHYG